jgi:hypothetical protein
MKNSLIKTIVILLLSAAIFATYNKKSSSKIIINSAPKETEVIEIKPKETEKLKTFSISTKIPEFLTYPQTVEQIKKWKEEASEIVQVEKYGKTKKGTDLYYIRVNSDEKKVKPKVLITACIHGNEPLASGIVMAYIGNLLDQYNKNREITDLVNTRDLYFVPVVSPDSYPDSRMVDGVDPNRDFSSPKFPNHQSSPSVAALIDLYWKVRPSAVISGHTFGRLILTPYGDRYDKSFHEKDYTRIVGKMSEMTGYKRIHAAELYSRPIQGTEVDWFYRNGSMAVVVEFGTHQHKPSFSDILNEFNKTKDAISLFIKEAPIVPFTVADEEIDFSKNTGIAHTYRKPANEELNPASHH